MPELEHIMSDTELTIDRLAARVERLEGSVNPLRLLIPLLLLFILALGALHTFQSWMAFAADTVITGSVTTGSIALRNATGGIVALLSSEDGLPQITLFDAQKKVRLTIGLAQNGRPALSLLDPEQGARAVLSLNDQQDPSLTMFNAEKLPRAIIDLDTSGSGYLHLSGGKGGINLSAFAGKMTWNPVGEAAQDIPVQR
jgi:hypothetical protein